ncbi:hypothetical protein S245_052584, partial [Arachis hypogaea]
SHKLISSPLFSENHRSHRSPLSEHPAATASLSSPSSPSLCSPVLRPLSSPLQPPFVLLLHRATNSSPLLSSLRTIESTAAPNRTATAAPNPAATASLSSPSSPSLCSPVLRPLSSPLLAFHLAAGNKLTGNIPQTYVKGNALHWIDFSSNKLYGQLPRALVNCRMLEFLDVRHNHFNDSFPFWLGSLPKLYGSFFIDLSSFSLFNKGVVMDYLGGQYLCGHEVPAWKLKQCWHGLKYLWFVLVQLVWNLW